MFLPRVLTRTFTWRAISSGSEKLRKIVQLCFSTINHLLCRVWCCDFLAKNTTLWWATWRTTLTRLLRWHFFVKHCLLVQHQGCRTIFLIGDQKVQDDRGEQFLFPQRWTKVSAKKILHFKILTFPFHFACKLVICNEKFLFSWFIIALLQGWRRLHLHVRLCNRRTLLRRLIKMENNQTFWPKNPIGRLFAKLVSSNWNVKLSPRKQCQHPRYFMQNECDFQFQYINAGKYNFKTFIINNAIGPYRTLGQ